MHQLFMAQSTGDAEYTDCISVEGLDSLNKHPAYDTKQSVGEIPVMLEFGECVVLFIVIAPRSILVLSGCTW